MMFSPRVDASPSDANKCEPPPTVELPRPFCRDGERFVVKEGLKTDPVACCVDAEGRRSGHFAKFLYRSQLDTPRPVDGLPRPEWDGWQRQWILFATYDAGQEVGTRFSLVDGEVRAITPLSNGVASGEMVRFGPGCSRARSRYVNGESHGPHEATYATGAVALRTAYRHGRRHGPYVTYHADGREEYRTEFVNGTGEIRSLTPAGLLTSRARYLDGEPHGWALAWRDGALSRARCFRRGAMLIDDVDLPDPAPDWLSELPVCESEPRLSAELLAKAKRTERPKFDIELARAVRVDDGQHVCGVVAEFERAEKLAGQDAEKRALVTRLRHERLGDAPSIVAECAAYRRVVARTREAAQDTPVEILVTTTGTPANRSMEFPPPLILVVGGSRRPLEAKLKELFVLPFFGTERRALVRELTPGDYRLVGTYQDIRKGYRGWAAKHGYKRGPSKLGSQFPSFRVENICRVAGNPTASISICESGAPLEK